MSDPSIPTQAEAVEALRTAFPDGFFAKGRVRQKVPMDQLVLEYGPLTQEHIVAAEEFLESGVSIEPQKSIKELRHSHHRAAQFVALGLDDVTVSRLANYSPGRIAILRNDPAFMELVAHYSTEVHEEWADFVSTAKDLSMDVLGVIRDKLEDTPNAQLSLNTLSDLLKTLADRTGNAPVTRSLNVNANLDMGSDLRRARERAEEAQRAALLDPPHG